MMTMTILKGDGKNTTVVYREGKLVAQKSQKKNWVCLLQASRPVSVTNNLCRGIQEEPDGGG